MNGLPCRIEGQEIRGGGGVDPLRDAKNTQANMVICLVRYMSMKRNYNCTNVKIKLSHYTPQRRLGETRYRSYSFMTSALDGGGGQHHAVATLYPQGKDPW
jgi:hypothetical protein